MTSHTYIPHFTQRRNGLLFAWVALLVSSVSISVFADVRLPGVFSDNMVLQADIAAPMWGWAEPGEQVTVTVNDQVFNATADDQGAWRLQLLPMPAGTPLQITVQAGNTITIQNAVVGEVWLCSGQSQIEQGVNAIQDKGRIIAQADDPGLRLFVVPRIQAETPQTQLDGQWVVCTPQNIAEIGWRGFSAIGYFFGRQLRQELKVPVGMIQSAIGGTPIEVWMSWEVLESTPAAEQMAREWQSRIKRYDPQQAQQRYEQKLAEWKQNVAQAEAGGEKPSEEPKPPISPAEEAWCPASRYNSMIAPLAPYAMRGVLWYQGYSSRYRAAEYQTLFPLMIRSWRTLWGREDMPFYFVQHANYAIRGKDAERKLLADIREAQAQGLTEPHTGMVVTLDLGHSQYLHFPYKEPVARRLLNLALAKTYGRAGLASESPMLRDATVQGGKMRVGFDHVYDGLKTRGGGPIGGFEIAGSDGTFVAAQAKLISSDTIEVWSDQVPAPVAVRYAWADDPADANLYNSADLPAAPFRATR